MPRVWIGGANHHFFDSSGDNRLGAGRCAALRTTGLQSDVERCAFDALLSLLRIPNGLDFRVGLAGASVPTAADDPAAFDQDRSYHRIRRSDAVTAAGQAQGQAHVLKFSAHPNGFRARTGGPGDLRGCQLEPAAKVERSADIPVQ